LSTSSDDDEAEAAEVAAARALLRADEIDEVECMPRSGACDNGAADEIDDDDEVGFVDDEEDVLWVISNSFTNSASVVETIPEAGSERTRDLLFIFFDTCLCAKARNFRLLLRGLSVLLPVDDADDVAAAVVVDFAATSGDSSAFCSGGFSIKLTWCLLRLVAFSGLEELERALFMVEIHPNLFASMDSLAFALCSLLLLLLLLLLSPKDVGSYREDR